MACLLKKRGKYYRKSRLDIWGYYGGYYNDAVVGKKRGRKVNNTLSYWMRFHQLRRDYGWFNRQRYVYRVWNRKRFASPKKIKKNFVKPRFLLNFYMVLKKKVYVKYVKKALKGKFGRGFASIYVGYLEGRLIVIVYRLNIINNVFIIKNAINAGLFYINNKKKKHINTRMHLGDILQINMIWKKIMQRDMYKRATQSVMRTIITNFYINYLQLYFIYYKSYNIKEIKFPIRIDLYRAIDFIGPLR